MSGREMSDSRLRRGEDVILMQDGQWSIFWDGEKGGWIKFTDPVDLENWQ